VRRLLSLSYLALLCFVSVTGCGGASPVTYLAHAGNGVALIQWTRNGDTVRGSLSVAYVDPFDLIHLKSGHFAFRGTIRQSRVTLTFEGEPAFSTIWTGSLERTRLSLAYTTAGGAPTTLRFEHGSIEQYDAAVAAIKALVTATRRNRQGRSAAPPP
jgi:hypothetical protein